MAVSGKDRAFIGRLVFVVMFFLAWSMIIMFRLVYLMVPVVARFLGDYGTKLLVTTCIVGLGLLAYEFKKRDQLFYGRVEICFGIASAITLAFSSKPNEMHLTQWASLVGAAFVIARGRNNISDARRNPGTATIPFFFAEGPEENSNPT
jgi:hypothetical protein